MEEVMKKMEKYILEKLYFYTAAFFNQSAFKFFRGALAKCPRNCPKLYTSKQVNQA